MKFKAFGKSKVNFKKVDKIMKVPEASEEEEAKDLMRKQSEKMEAEIKKAHHLS